MNLDWNQQIEELESRLQDLERARNISNKYWGKPPPWVRGFLEHGSAEGAEDRVIIECAKWLTVVGFGRKDICDKIWKSPLADGYRKSNDKEKFILLVKEGWEKF